MASPIELVAGLSSAILRLCAFTFLRWIPGHHFPPVIIASLIVYLTCVFVFPDAFASRRPTLREDFPAAADGLNADGLSSSKENDQNASLIGQSDVVADPIFDKEDRSIFKILVFGIPEWGEREYSYFTIGLNALLALFALDLVFRGPLLYPSPDLRFSRVGFVDSNSAKVLFREPNPAEFPVYAYYKSIDGAEWITADRIFYLGADTDYTYPLLFSGLKPSTYYTYSLSNKLSGTFSTAPIASSPASNRLTFVTSSCIKANFPYNPFSDALAIPGFTHLSTVLRSLPTPASFMLFLGDFIYVDVPLRLSSSFSHYRSEYRRVYASPSWSLPGLSSLPWLHTLDDHEIANDWSGGNSTEPFPAASDPFIHYHVSVNPPTPASTTSDVECNTTFFQFARGPASFFMLDTRRYRTNPEPRSDSSILAAKSDSGDPSTPANLETIYHTMLGSAQLSALLTFLSKPEPPHIHWKIIASSVPFTKNWRFGTSDTWGGFLAERSIILDAMHAAEAHLGIRIIILSGDRHEFGAIRFPPRVPISKTLRPANTSAYVSTPQSGPHEFSVGPLSMFYLPFRTFRQIDDEDVAIKYIPDGNSKIGVVELSNLEGVGEQKSLLKYSLYVDGKVTWEYTLTSPGPEFSGYRGGWGLGDGLWS